MKKLILIVFILAGFFSMPASALTEETADAPTRTIEDYIKDYVDVPKGATDWKVFGQTKEISIEGKDAEGFDFQYYKPEFSKDVRALDGQEITLKGFMFPLDSTEEQSQFLFGPFPVNCPFQYHVGPSLVVEVYVEKHPVTFTLDPVVVKGTLELVENDPETSTFYRLKNARKID
jgi:hypothetical protein